MTTATRDTLYRKCPACGGDTWTVTADPLPSGEPGEPYQVQCPTCEATGFVEAEAPEAALLREALEKIAASGCAASRYTGEDPFVWDRCLDVLGVAEQPTGPQYRCLACTAHAALVATGPDELALADALPLRGSCECDCWHHAAAGRDEERARRIERVEQRIEDLGR